MDKKAVFLDRDGVINKEIGYLNKIKDFLFISDVFKACSLFKEKNFEIVIITNQSGIARGMYSEEDFHALNRWMLNEFSNNNISILDVEYCPHGPEDYCTCRKPKPGMIFSASYKHGINLKESWLIGDKETDIQAAINAGISNKVLIKTGHEINEADTMADFVVNSLTEVTKLIN